MYVLPAAGPVNGSADTFRRFTRAVKSSCPVGYLRTSSTSPSPLR